MSKNKIKLSAKLLVQYSIRFWPSRSERACFELCAVFTSDLKQLYRFNLSYLLQCSLEMHQVPEMKDVYFFFAHHYHHSSLAPAPFFFFSLSQLLESPHGGSPNTAHIVTVVQQQHPRVTHPDGHVRLWGVYFFVRTSCRVQVDSSFFGHGLQHEDFIQCYKCKWELDQMSYVVFNTVMYTRWLCERKAFICH